VERRLPLGWDALLAAALFTATAIEIAVVADDEGGTVPAGAIIVLALQCALLVVRRRRPVVVWAAVGVLAAVYGLSDFPDPTLQYPMLVAIYSVAAWTQWRTAARAGLATFVSVFVVLALDRGKADALDWVVVLLSVCVAWLLGNNVRTARAYAEELRERAARLERERDEEARRAVADERVRIARELHDVAAHHVSVIALHAEAGEAMLPGDPDRAAGAFRTIAGTARDTLAQLRRVVEVLRADDAAAARQPQPSLDELPRLVAQVQEAGLPVDVAVEGAPRPVAAAVGLSAYRIVQEALTNVVRHAGPARAVVTLRYEPDALAVEVVDDGRGSDGPGAPGHGLIGMGERAAAVGGTFTAAPRPGGGFSVSARLPL
jgi:signal transduction histidine kinase